jgi:carbon monoxide dehydrogenase subunit G
MTDNLKFESRTGRLSCKTSEVFSFITDIRNFEQFIPEGKITNWQASSDNCSFQVPALSTISVRITGKTPCSEVVYTGNAMKTNDFRLTVLISENERKLADVRISLNAEINPILKMMVTGPISKFLETLISEMEKFERWNPPSRES